MLLPGQARLTKDESHVKMDNKCVQYNSRPSRTRVNYVADYQYRSVLKPSSGSFCTVLFLRLKIIYFCEQLP